MGTIRILTQIWILIGFYVNLYVGAIVQSSV